MKTIDKNKNISKTVSTVLLFILLVLIIVESYVNPGPHSWSTRSLAIAAFLLLGISTRKQ